MALEENVWTDLALFVTIRTNFVEADELPSSSMDVKICAAQGATMGSILFIMYIHKLNNFLNLLTVSYGSLRRKIEVFS